jgi:hypothetical protein
MDGVIVLVMLAPLLVLAMFAQAVGSYGGRPNVVMPDEAKTLLRAALPRYTHRLRGLEFEQFEGSSNRFYFFTATWAAPEKSSVVVGNYAVDPFTGDVWSATSSCNELSTTTVRKLQKTVRSELGLSWKQYQRIKTHGPLCDR